MEAHLNNGLKSKEEKLLGRPRHRCDTNSNINSKYVGCEDVILNELPQDVAVVRLFGGGDELLCSMTAVQYLSVEHEGSCTVKSVIGVNEEFDVN